MSSATQRGGRLDQYTKRRERRVPFPNIVHNREGHFPSTENWSRAYIGSFVFLPNTMYKRSFQFPVCTSIITDRHTKWIAFHSSSSATVYTFCPCWVPLSNGWTRPSSCGMGYRTAYWLAKFPSLRRFRWLALRAILLPSLLALCLQGSGACATHQACFVQGILRHVLLDRCGIPQQRWKLF